MSALVTALQIGFVFLILGAFAFFARRYGNKHNRSGTINVLARAPLAGRSSATVLTVAGKAYLVGVTETQVTLLAELDMDALPQPDTHTSDPETGEPSPAQQVPNTLGAALVHVTKQLRNKWTDRKYTPAHAGTTFPSLADLESDTTHPGEVK